ncbi:MAG: formate acetyltransferase [Desulfobacteraceae bacterium]|nr:MAG: formate acetyltransferase [Desulfobacteraceae bacterium]
MFFFQPPSQPKSGFSPTNILLNTLLRVFAANFNLRPSLKKYLKSDLGWIDFTIGFKTNSGSLQASVALKNGKVSVSGAIPEKTDTLLTFNSERAVVKLLGATPTEQIFMVLQGQVTPTGNASYLNLFFFFLSLLLHGKQKKLMEKERAISKKALLKTSPNAKKNLSNELTKRFAYRMACDARDPNVQFLEDPFLSGFCLDDFPRVKQFLDDHFTIKPEICPELPKLVTDWHKQNGYETDASGRPWHPTLRKARAYKYVMENRKPLIRKNDLIAGTTTTKEIGAVVYPEGHGTMIWGELLTVPHRTLNPCDVSQETLDILHHEVFPYWANRNFREWVREKYRNPLCQQIDDRFAIYFTWKTVTISHTIPDFPKLLRLGTSGIIAEIKEKMAEVPEKIDPHATLEAMILCLEGLTAYGKNLARHAADIAASETNPVRKAELEKLSAICSQVPEHPARTLDEAVNAIWIAWVGLHMESTNAGLSLGRLDQWLQPYFAADMALLSTPQGKTDYIKHAVELIGCFYMRCTDHLPLTPDIANWVFGGSSSDQAITLGGVTPDGGDGVCDMTYIFLKVTEMLSIRDPNVNARFHPGKNSDTYLKRLCEVNLITAATPSLHNDHAVMTSLEEFNYPIEDLRNWSATGCVEPTLSGKHIGHTNFQMMNMVAALEMALNNGTHPLLGWKFGPDTGEIDTSDTANNPFPTFDDFFNAFTTQFAFIIDQSIEYNEMLATAHQIIRPTPLLSSLIGGCIASGRDVTRGGAAYNSSGAALIGLADVTDSLMAIKVLVYEQKKTTLPALKKAVDDNFEHDPALHALATRKVSLFGSGSREAVDMADRITRFAHDYYGSKSHYRGGKYTVGFWSMSNHVAYGTFTGALPSGRLRGKAFTPGLTPEPNASNNLLDNIRDVASLNPKNINNNIAFNVKVVPSAGDSREKTVADIFAYVKTYFDLGGMQMQLNVVTSETLKDAMAHPENYRNLLVRISGYNAYFVTLNRDMQIELIERAEYGM